MTSPHAPAEDRPRLLLLHGALGASAQLRPLAGALGASFDVRLLDFEGHGPSAGRDRPFRIEHFADNVLEYLAELPPARTHLFGYSMGGYVALFVAAHRPELVHSVATLATKFRWTPESAAREAAQLDAERIRSKVPRFAEALAARHTGRGWEAVLGDTRDMMHALGERAPLTASVLASVPHPARILVGDRDTTVGVDEALEAYRSLRAGELEVLPGTPHPLERVSLSRLAASLADYFTAAQRGAHSP